MAKKIAILGSTGSIGQNALKVIDALGENYSVFALTAHNSTELLAEQALKYRPKYIAVTNPDKYSLLKQLAGHCGAKILAGPESLVDIARLDEIDTVLAAVVGAAGLPAVLAGAESGKQLAIANKEPLVIAGRLLTETAKKHNATILPIDSEHSAVFQAMQCGCPSEVEKIILTGSGGPFRNFTAEQIQNATLQQALNHPTWDMGPKITIDSATMMNKSLEIIEAKWLFDIPVEKIEVLIHPESIIHSMVEFIDNSVIAQLGTPDMCLPIQYALTYPARVKSPAQKLDLLQTAQLSFEKPDFNRFRALKLAYQVAKTGQSAPTVFNAANEAAVEHFIAGNIKFVDIVELIENCLDIHDIKDCSTLEQLLEADQWARNFVQDQICRV